MSGSYLIVLIVLEVEDILRDYILKFIVLCFFGLKI